MGAFSKGTGAAHGFSTTYRHDYRDWRYSFPTSYPDLGDNFARHQHFSVGRTEGPRFAVCYRNSQPDPNSNSCVLDSFQRIYDVGKQSTERLCPSGRHSKPTYRGNTTYRHHHCDLSHMKLSDHMRDIPAVKKFSRGSVPHIPLPDHDFFPQIKYGKDKRPWHQKVLDACNKEGPWYPVPRKRKVENIYNVFIHKCAAEPLPDDAVKTIIVHDKINSGNTILDYHDRIETADAGSSSPGKKIQDYHDRIEVPDSLERMPKRNMHMHERIETEPSAPGSPKRIDNYCDKIEVQIPCLDSQKVAYEFQDERKSSGAWVDYPSGHDFQATTKHPSVTHFHTTLASPTQVIMDCEKTLRQSLYPPATGKREHKPNPNLYIANNPYIRKPHKPAYPTTESVSTKDLEEYFKTKPGKALCIHAPPGTVIDYTETVEACGPSGIQSKIIDYREKYQIPLENPACYNDSFSR